MTSKVNYAVDIDKDEDAYIQAMKISRSFVLAPTVAVSIDLNLFGIIAKISSSGSSNCNACVSSSEIASHLGIKDFMNAPSVLDQMLRLLATYSLLTSSYRPSENGKVEILYGISSVGKLFLENEDGVSLSPFASLVKYHDLAKICSQMKGGVLDGRNASATSHYENSEKNEKYRYDFDKAMSEHSKIVMKSVLRHYKGFEWLTSLVDVGGGIGTSLNMIISQYPAISGVNFDLPYVLDTKLSIFPGIEYVGGDMFEGIPKGDAILLKWILHNWGDEKCLAILKNCYKALPELGKVIVIETVVPSSPDTSALAKYVSQLDIVMLYQFHGKERTELEYKALAEAAGFSKFNVQHFGCGQSVIELSK